MPQLQKNKLFGLTEKNFLDNILDFDKFENDFTLLYYKTNDEVNMFIIDLKQIEKLQPSTRSYRFSIFIDSVLRQFEEIENGHHTKQEVKNYIKKAYLKFQKFEE